MGLGIVACVALTGEHFACVAVALVGETDLGTVDGRPAWGWFRLGAPSVPLAQNAPMALTILKRVLHHAALSRRSENTPIFEPGTW